MFYSVQAVRPQMKVIGVEAADAAGMTASLAAGEVVAFWAVLAKVGRRWAFPIRALNTPVFNVLANTLFCVNLFVAPVTRLRFPDAVTPHVWSGWIVWTTLGANWAMTGLALTALPRKGAAASNATLGVGVFDDAGDRTLVCAALGTCTLVAVAGAVFALGQRCQRVGIY